MTFGCDGAFTSAVSASLGVRCCESVVLRRTSSRATGLPRKKSETQAIRNRRSNPLREHPHAHEAATGLDRKECRDRSRKHPPESRIPPELSCLAGPSLSRRTETFLSACQRTVCTVVRLLPVPVIVLRTQLSPQIDAVRGIRIKLQMNSSRQPAAGSKRQRIKLEIRVAKSPMAKAGAHRVDERNHAKKTNTGDHKYARIIAADQLWDGRGRYGDQHHVAGDANHPRGDCTFLVQTLRPAARPIRSPQPGRRWIGFFHGRLLLQAPVTIESARIENLPRLPRKTKRWRRPQSSRWRWYCGHSPET